MLPSRAREQQQAIAQCAHFARGHDALVFSERGIEPDAAMPLARAGQVFLERVLANIHGRRARHVARSLKIRLQAAAVVAMPVRDDHGVRRGDIDSQRARIIEKRSVRTDVE